MAGAYSQESLESHFNQINERLRAIEAQLGVLSDEAGVSYDRPGADVPEDVIELVKAGKQMDAVKRYRELTSASFEDARDVINSI
jgi:ribosomal protein L7/L12